MVYDKADERMRTPRQELMIFLVLLADLVSCGTLVQGRLGVFTLRALLPVAVDFGTDSLIEHATPRRIPHACSVHV